jgi:uncharacterized repeat protein (TIGR01451 family)
VISNQLRAARERHSARKGTPIVTVVALIAALLSVVFVAVAPPASAAARPFAIRYQTIDNGDIFLAANTLISCSWPANTVVGSACYKGQTGIGTTTAGINMDSNNGVATVFVDADGSAAQPKLGGGTIATFNSSSSDVVLPAGATVLYAALYFTGRLSGTSVAIAAPAAVANKSFVQFRTPTAAYKQLTAGPGAGVAGAGTNPTSQFDIDVAGGAANQDFAGMINVTSDLQAVEAVNGTANGSYWVANVNGATGTQAYAGWTLAVAYKDSQAARRQLTIFDGYQSVSAGPVTIPLTGFRTPPTGIVKTKLGLVAYEGDAATAGDYGTFGAITTGTPPKNVIQDTLNPWGSNSASDLMNSSITRPNPTAGASFGLPWHATTKNPNFQNQYGFDADLINADGKLPNGTLATDSFNLILATGGDVYYPHVVTTAIEVYVPDFSNSIHKSAVDLTNPANPQSGDTIEYTIDMGNNGNDPADSSIMTDVIPPGVTFVPGSMKVDGVGYTDSAEAAGNADVANTCGVTASATLACPQVSTGPYVVMRVGSGATSTLGGAITTGGTSVVKFRVTINSGFSPGSTITNTARIDYVQHTLGTPGSATSTAGVIGTASIPSTPDMVAGSDSGASSTDNITSVTQPILTGTANAGATVAIYDGTTLLGTTTANGSGLYSFTPLSPLAAGAHSFSATAAFGTGSASVASSALSVTIDTVAPATTVPFLATASDSGTSNSDNLTNVTLPTIVGTTEPNATVSIYDGATLLGTAVANASGAWSFVVGTAFTVGAHSLTTTVLDLAGNASVASSATVVTIDTAVTVFTFPAMITPTANLQPAFSGTADPLSVITIKDAGVVIGTTTADAAGNWTFTPPALLATGSRLFTVVPVDPAGNTSAGLSQTLNITAPVVAVPTLPDLATASDSGSSSTDNVTNITAALTFNGNATPASTVKVYDGATLKATVVADAAGNWTTSFALAAGSHAINTTATVGATTSAVSPILTVVVDTATTATLVGPATATSASGTPVFSGTAEVGATVQIKDAGVVIGTVTADSAGTWTFTTVTLLAAGARAFTITSTDPAGNTFTSAANTITIDPTPPATPVIPDLLAASDTGTSATDNITSDITPDLTGTAEPNSTVKIYDNGTLIGTVTATAGGVWTFTPPALTTGTHPITVTATDAVGNVSPISPALNIVIDPTAPVPPSAPDMTAATDTGISSTDDLTKNATPTFTGTSEPNAIISVYDGSTLLGTTTANASGNWSYTPGTALTTGTHILKTTATDLAGNVSGYSGTLAITVDTTAPAAPPVAVLPPTSDSGTSSSDGITNITTPTITGTAVAGSTVSIYDGATLIGTTVADGLGAWSFSMPTLTAGVHSVTTTASDPAGNASAASPALSITVDAVAPASPTSPDLATASDTGTSSTDNITKTTTPVFNGTAENNATVKIYDGATLIGTVTASAVGAWTFTVGTALTAGVHNISATSTDVAGNTSVVSDPLAVTIDTTAAVSITSPANGSSTANNNPTFTGTADPGSTVTMKDGATVLGTAVADVSGNWTYTNGTSYSATAHTFSATVVDIAGNAATSANVSVTITVPVVATPGLPDLATGSDTGASTTDNVTSSTSPTITGTAVANSTVNIYDGATLIGTVSANGSGVWTLSPTLTAGTHDITATATVGGNTSSASSPLRIVIDATAPSTPPIVDLATASDSGVFTTDNITSDTSPTLNGTAEANSTVKIYDGATLIGTVTADASGAWTLTPTLAIGSHDITVTSTDLAGNVSSASPILAVVVDIASPVAPSAPDLTAGSDTGLSSTDNLTKTTAPTLSGTAEPNATVKLYDGATLIGTSTADAFGNWTILSNVLSAGAHTLTATATDAAGNLSAASSSLVITIDVTAPIFPTSPALAVGSDSGSSSTDKLTNVTTPTLTGSAEPNSTVSVYDGGVLLGTAVVNAGGTWNYTSPTLSSGAHAFTVAATDQAGNTSGLSVGLTINVDAVAPATPTVPDLTAASDTGSSSTDNITKNITPVLTGVAEANAIVKIYDGATLLTTVTADGSGNWTYTSTTLSTGVHNITSTATDAAGNVSTASPILAITIDTSATVTLVGPAGGTSTGNATPTFSGVAEPFASVSIKDGPTVIIGNVVADALGNWSFTPVTPLAVAAHNFSAVTVDIAGNSASSTTNAVTITATAVATPSLPDMLSASDTGVSNTDNITSNNTPALTGTAVANSTVKIYDGVTLIGTVTANGSGVWTFTTPVLTVGAHAITVTATVGSNTSSPSSALTITVDTAAPAAPAALDLTTATDTGTSSTDNITSITTPTFTGTAEAFATVKLYDGATLVGTVAADSAGNWSITSSALPSGVHSITSTATDVAGNVSSATAALSVTIDTTAPATATAPDLAAASDSGVSNTDNLTKITTPLLQGTTEAGAIVKIYDGASLLGTVSADGTGNWTFTTSALSSGVHSFTTTSTDASGNLSAASPALAVTVDTTGPAVAITSPTDGSSTNNLTPTFIGTAEANATIVIKDGATVLGTTTANGAGAWTFTPSANMAGGSHTITALATDAAGNSTTSSPVGLIVVAPPPATTASPSTPDLISASDSGSSTTDDITNVTTPTFTGTSVANATINLYDGATLIGTATASAGGVWSVTSSALTPGVHSITATATANSIVSALSGALSVTIDTSTTVAIAAPLNGAALATGTPVISGTAEAGASITISDGATMLTTVVADGAGAWSFTPPAALTDGSHTLNAAVTDVAGNTSSTSSSITIDTTAPATPSVPDLTAASDTGVSSTDNITTITTPTLSGNAEPGSTVSIYDGGVLIGTAIANASGVWSITTPVLSSGAHSITTQATDAVGNISPLSAALVITIDSIAPVAPSVPDLLAVSDSGSSATDNLTNVTTPQLSGTSEPGATVNLYEGATLVGTTVADGSGNWTVTISSALAVGPHGLSAVAIDVAGNVSPTSAQLTIIIDTATTVAITSPASGGSTANNRPVISGTAEVGATVVVKNGATTIGTVVADALGNWTLTPATGLPDGVRSLTAVTTDVAGNSATSAAVSITVDTLAPAVPPAPTLNVGSNTGSTLDTITANTTPSISGTAEIGATVRVYDGATLLGTAVANGLGNWTFTVPTALSTGVHAITVTAADTLGNTSAASVALSITIDNIAPAAPVLDLTALSDSGSSNTDNITSDTSPTISGTAEANATIKFYEGATLLGTSTADGTGAWSFTVSPDLLDGAHSLTATATDIAANTSVLSISLDITIDTVAPISPLVPVLDPASNTGSLLDNLTSNTRPVITGGSELEPFATVKVYDNGVLVATVTADASGLWSYRPATALTNGAHAFTVTLTDVAGNLSPTSSPLTVTIDSNTPATPPAPLLADGSNTGSLADTITAVNIPTITGTAEAGSLVQISVDGTPLGATTANGLGQWSFTPIAALADGVRLFTVTATDLAANTSAVSLALSVTIDTLAPGVPAVPVLATASNSGSTADSITKFNTPTLTGTASANATVKIYDGAVLLATVTADGSGAWTYTPTVALVDGNHSITVTATDVANNTSAASPALVLTIDTVVPATATAPSLNPASNSGSTADTITNVNMPVITGTTEAFAVVAVYDGATLLGTATANGSGAWLFSPSAPLSDGSHPITTKSTDVAGNVSASSASLPLVIDATAPIVAVAPTLDPLSNTASLADNVTSNTAPTIRGAAEVGSVVKIYEGATLLGTLTVDASGTWSFPIAGPLSNGVHTYRFTATDVAANTSASSPNLAITIDTVAPASPTAPALSPLTDSGVVGDLLTNNTTPTLTGAAEANSTVSIYLAGTLVGTALADASGNWSYTTTVLSAGSYSYTTKATDVAGNISSASSATVITVDTVAPTAPPVAVLNPASDTGTLGDNVTKTTTPTLTGTAEANSTIKVYDGATLLGTTTVSAGGTWSFTPSATLADGVHVITTTSADPAANVSAASAPLNLTIDTTAPTAPPVAILASASDSGVLGDNRTNITTPTFTGTGEVGSTIKVYDGGVLLGSTIVTAGGTWSYVSTPLTQGTHLITTTSTDVAGNTSAVSATRSIVIDTTAPVVPPAPVLASGSDSGVLGDNITNVTSPTLTGTGEIGSVISIYDGATLLGTTTVSAGGTWSYTSTTLTNGVHPLTVTSTDAAGNTSAASSNLNITIDTNAPATPPIAVLSPLSDSGVANDNLTSVTTPVLTGTAESNSTVTVYRGGVSVGTVVTNGSGAWTFTSGTLTNGTTYSFVVTATDAAGNTSVGSVPLVLTIDTLAPTAPPIAVLTAGSDTGLVGDNLTKITTPTLSGSAEPNSVVSVYDGGTLLGTTVVAANGVWGFVSPTLVDGLHSITTRSTDAAGNISAASVAVNLLIDATAPLTPSTAALATASDSGTLGDGITKFNVPVITGTAEANSTVKVYRDGVQVGTVTANGAGAWSFTSAGLPDAVYVFTTTATDAAANVSAIPAGFLVTIDTGIPAVPATVALSPASDSGVLGDNITSVTTPVITGVGEVGSVIKVYDGATLLGTTTVAANGTWTFTSPILADGVHAITSTSTDASGNTSAASTALILIIDTIAPSAPPIAMLSPASDTGTLLDNITSVKTPTLTGTAQANSTVSVYRDGVLVGTVVADALGNWTFTSLTLADGPYTFTTKSTDAAGNVSAFSAPLGITIDSTSPLAPSKPVLSPASDSGVLLDNITSVTLPVLTGTGEPGSTITIYDGVVSLGTALVAANGTWTFTVDKTGLSDGAHSITATSTDVSANVSPPSPTLTLTIDTTAPAAPSTATLSPASDSGVLGDNVTAVVTPILTGTGEPGSVVKIYDGATLLGTTVVAANGTWSFTSPTLTDGVHPITSTSTDAAGNISAPSAGLALTIDTTSPLATPAPVLSPASDSGVLLDNITKVTTPTLTGTGEVGSVIKIYDGTTLLGSAVVGAGGTWSFTSPTLTDGVHSLTTTSTDPAGNVSAISLPLALTIDTTAPVVPPISVLTAGSDSGALGDNLTNDNTPTLSGAGEPYSTIKVFDGVTLLGTATVAADGTWAFTVKNALSDGVHSITTTSTDPAFNTSAASVPLALTIDTTAPVVPPISVLTVGSDSGVLGDNLTKVAAPTLSGTGEPLSTITIYDGSTVLGTTVVAADGTWTYTSAVLADGVHEITTTSTDLATNTSTHSAILTLTIDTTAPVAPPVAVLTVGSDSGAPLDNITNDDTPTLSGTGEPLSTITIYEGLTVLGTATVSKEGFWSFTTPVLSDAAHVITTTSTDLANNTSALSSPLVLTIDTTAPVAPPIAVLSDKSDSGVLGDNITSNATPTITGTAEPFSVVNVYDQTSNLIGTTVADADGKWSIDSVLLADGLHLITSTSTDAAGNTSAPSVILNLTIDATAPKQPPVASLAVGSDDGSSATDLLTSINTPSIIGTAEPFSVITVTDIETGIVLGTAITDAHGNWTFTTPLLADGSHTITTTATDAAGNVSSDSDKFSFIVQTQTDLSIVIAHVGPIVPGTPVTYSFTVTNNGPGDAFNASFVTTLPTGLTYTGFVGQDENWSCNVEGQTVTCQYAAIFATGISPLVTITADVASGQLGVVSMDATVSSITNDLNPTNNKSDSDSATVTPIADLTVASTHPTPIVAGTNTTYTVVVTNNGPSDAAGATVVTATLPAGMAFSVLSAEALSAGWTCNDAGQVVTCSNPAVIVVHTISTLDLIVAVAPGALPGPANAHVSATSPTFDPAVADNSMIDAGIITAVADLVLTSSHPEPVTAGTSLTYTLSVYNAGPSDAPATAGAPITIVHTLPAGMTYTGFEGTDWNCDAVNQVVTCTYTAYLAAAYDPALVNITADVSAAVPVGTTLVGNTAITTSPTPDPLATNNTVADPASILTSADLVLSTSISDHVVAGGGITYTLSVFNSGPSDVPVDPANPITVVNTLPVGVTYAGFSGNGWECTAVDQTVTCHYTSYLGANTDPALLDITGTVDPAASAGTVTINTASITASPTVDPNPENNGAVSPHTLGAEADLVVNSSHTEQLIAGGPVTYTLSVYNAGPSDVRASALSPITVVNTLPAGVIYNGFTGTDWTCDAVEQVVTCIFTGYLSATHDPALLTITTTVDPAAVVGSSLANEVAITSSPIDDPLASNNTATDAGTVVGLADLVVGKTHDGAIVAGSPMTYTVSVFNSGPSDVPATAAHPVHIVDTLPAGLSFESFSGYGWTCDAVGPIVTCDYDQYLAADYDPALLEITVTVDASLKAGTVVANSATVATSATADPNSANNAVTDSASATTVSDLVLNKSHEGVAVAGTDVAYTLSVFNAGPSDLAPDPTKPLTVVDTLPAGETFVDGDGDGWTCEAVDQIVTCTYSSLLAANYDPSLLVIHATVDPSTQGGTILTNQAAITSSPQADPNPANDVAADPTSVVSEADLMIYKVHDGPLVPGGTVTYTLGVFDTGSSDLRASERDPLVVVDTLPAGLSFQSYSGYGWTCDAVGQVVTCLYDQYLGAGYDPALVDIVVGVSPGLTPGTNLTNTAEINAAPTTDPNPANDTATDPDVVQHPAATG